VMVDDKDPGVEMLMRHADRPLATADDTVQKLVEQMARNIASDGRSSGVRRRGLVATVLASVLVVGTAGVAYAVTTIDWSRFWMGAQQWEGWATSPDASFTYTLPGGGSCEMRVGDVTFSPDPGRPANVAVDQAAADAARDYLQTTDLWQELDVETAITLLRGTDLTYSGEGTTEVPFGYGTDNYNADVEYNLAVRDAVYYAVTGHVGSLGLPVAGWGFSAQEQCTGEQK